MQIRANFVDILQRTIFFAEVSIASGKIASIRKLANEPQSATPFIMPGFVDAHIHIESSMLVPSEFARMAVVHGTVGTVSDPHEIGNVLGVKGVEFMLENGREVPFKFCFGIPSCVPATTFETAGAVISPDDIDHLFQQTDITYLAEMMNWPGVIFEDAEVLQKLAIAKKHGKQIDGHAPGLRGKQAAKYFASGISTDHECFTYDEGLEKAKLGVKILIREGSAAKNYEALIPLIKQFPKQIMFCSDDKHPDELAVGHINKLVSRAVKEGYDLFDVLYAAGIHPVEHYRMKVGLLREGDAADFILVNNLTDFEVHATFIDGVKVAEAGKSLIKTNKSAAPNQFKIGLKKEDDFAIYSTNKQETVKVIVAEDGQLITKETTAELTVEVGILQPNVAQDVLLMAVVNRYNESSVALAFINNFGIKAGAIASSVGHDSHNIIAVGVDAAAVCKAVNLIVKEKGGVSVSGPHGDYILPLPVAGIMSNEDGYKVADLYTEIDSQAKKLGSTLSAPFMTLSFMALLVIPQLKLSDKGLFDGADFQFVDLIKSK